MKYPPLLRLLFTVAVLGCSTGRAPLWSAEPLEICADRNAVGLPEWMRSATIYEVNVRQYSAAGTLSAVTADLPRIRALGADVVWLMPIHPVGKINRKGPLGSPYAVQDYLAVDPKMGTDADFQALVTGAHAHGLRVIMDWVGNHTAWDNPLTVQHPEFYVRDRDGHFQPPTGFDWTDVIQLDFSNPAVLDYETTALTHWVKDFGVDGFRCDFATGVPTKFWNEVFRRLRGIRPDLFFLAESEVPQHQLLAFNASYAFDMMQTFNAVAQGRAAVSAVDDTLARSRVRFPVGSTLIRYTSNHDENSWQGTEHERLGGGASTFAVLSFMLDGIPLVYNGQEVGLNRRLAFFEPDPIVWPAAHPLVKFYKTLCELRHANAALRTGALQRRLATTQNDAVYAILRTAGDQQVVAFLNLTARDATAESFDAALPGDWKDAFTGELVHLETSTSLSLRAWQYRVLVKEPTRSQPPIRPSDKS